MRLLGRKALSRIGGGVAGAWWPVPRQRVQGTICGGSGSAVRMRIVPRPRQVGHTEDMGLPGCVDADAPHVVVLGALSTSAYRPVNDEVLDIWRSPSSRHNDLLRHCSALVRLAPPVHGTGTPRGINSVSSGQRKSAPRVSTSMRMKRRRQSRPSNSASARSRRRY